MSSSGTVLNDTKGELAGITVSYIIIPQRPCMSIKQVARKMLERGTDLEAGLTGTGARVGGKATVLDPWLIL